jgi:hypothetical protein
MATGVTLSTLIYAGLAQLDGTLGSYQASQTVQIQRLQLNAQVGAVGGDVTVALFDEDGEELGSVTMLSASSFKNVALPATITLRSGDVVTAKFTGVDLGVAQYFTLSILGATSEYPVGPACCGPCYCGY